MPSVLLVHRPSEGSNVPSVEGSDPASRAARLRAAREEAGPTQEGVAAVLGVSAGTVKNWENPRTDAFPYKQLHELARLYEVSYWWLLDGGTGEPAGVPSEVLDELREIRRLVDDLQSRLPPREGSP